MEFSKFVKAWELDHREPTIDGYTISSCENGVETTLFSKLGDLNVHIYFVVCDLLKIKAERLEEFTSYAHQMLDADIKETMDFHPEYESVDDHTLYIASCETLAHSLNLHTEKIYMSLDSEGDDEDFPWYGLSRNVADKFGGPAASCAAAALGGIALATRLITARRYQYAWCAAIGAQRLASFSEGHLLSDEDARRRFAKHAVSNREDQQLKPQWEAHCKKAIESGIEIARLNDLFQIEGCNPDFKKNIDVRTLKRWAKESTGIVFKAGRPKK